MKKQRIYIDTSVFGGLQDEAFQEYTQPLFERIKNEEFDIIYSNVTENELEKAPKEVRAAIKLLPKDAIKYVKSDLEAARLAKKYIDEGVVGKTSFADCLHIALATIHFSKLVPKLRDKHIVNVVRIIGYNSVNLAAGYKPIDIRSPRELITYEN